MLSTNRRKSSGGDKISAARVPASKRLKPIDRISALPEALIVRILSLLPTKDNIGTGALSRRWQYLWTHVPKLHFADDYHADSDSDAFIKDVNQTLILCSGSKVKDFKVRLCYQSFYESDVGLWTGFAARNGSEKFELHLYPVHDSDYYTLPQLLFTNSSFRELRFAHCDVVPRGPVSWKSLKKLSIFCGNFSDDALRKILAGSPALEILDLFLVRGIHHLHFGNSSVKELIVSVSDDKEIDDRIVEHDQEASTLVVSAPNVQSLKVSGYFRTCRLVDMASLVEATLFGVGNEADEYPILTQDVLCSLSNVKALTLSAWVIQGIPMLPKNDGLPSLSKCKVLTIDMHLWKADPSAIASLLKITPGIEALTVTNVGSKYKFLQDRPSEHDYSNIDQYWASQEAASSYLTHLRVVKFIGFWDYRTHVLSFVRFLLKNARVLQKMIINLGMEQGSCKSVVPVELFETSQKLLNFPRSSLDAELFVYQ